MQFWKNGRWRRLGRKEERRVTGAEQTWKTTEGALGNYTTKGVTPNRQQKGGKEGRKCATRLLCRRWRTEKSH